MKFIRYKKGLMLFILCALLWAWPDCAFAASPQVGASSTELLQKVGDYRLKEMRQEPDAVTLCYRDAGGGQIFVAYTTRDEERLPQGVQQYYYEPLLYVCYSDDSTEVQLGSVIYTVGDCQVEVTIQDGSGQAIQMDKRAFLPILEQLQRGPVPFPTEACASCGRAVYRQAAEVGAWSIVSAAACGHGGKFRYNDAIQQREVRIRSVCVGCGREAETMELQEAQYCVYSQRWYKRMTA